MLFSPPETAERNMPITANDSFGEVNSGINSGIATTRGNSRCYPYTASRETDRQFEDSLGVNSITFSQERIDQLVNSEK